MVDPATPSSRFCMSSWMTSTSSAFVLTGTGLCDPEGTAPHRLRQLAELTTCSKNFWALMRLP